jgi:SAM-dependent methyltransferase
MNDPGKPVAMSRDIDAARPAGSVGSDDAHRRGLERYYTRYYRDALAIPGWRDLVRVRMDDRAHEAERFARLERAVGRSLAGSTLLDAGCGPGGFVAAAERAGADAFGVDLDPDAVALARARLGRDRVARAAAERLPFPSGAFDVVHCYSALVHVADPERSISEMVRVLRPGGQLYVHTPGPGAWRESHYKVLWLPRLPGPLARAYLRLRRRPTAFLATVHLVGERRCRRALERAGVTQVRVLDGDRDRAVGGLLWPLIRLYYRVCRVRPHVELVATR